MNKYSFIKTSDKPQMNTTATTGISDAGAAPVGHHATSADMLPAYQHRSCGVLCPSRSWPTGFLLCFNAVGWVIWPVKISPGLTYKVSSGTFILYSLAHSDRMLELVKALVDGSRMLVESCWHCCDKKCIHLTLETKHRILFILCFLRHWHLAV